MEEKNSYDLLFYALLRKDIAVKRNSQSGLNAFHSPNIWDLPLI